MRRIVIWLASTVTIVVLLFGYHTSTNQTSTAAPTSSAHSAPAPTPAPTPTAGSAATRAYTGSVAETRWGPVQVEISVADHRVSDVTVLQQPDGNRRDGEINDYALPILIQDTISAQSANIDMVSGATVTSEGYLHSLQAALDEAGI